eukprot:g2292.t1
MARHVKLLLVLAPALVAVDVPGGFYSAGYAQNPPLPGAEPGTPEALLRVHDDVFEPAFMKLLQAEAPIYERMAQDIGSLPNSKRTTFWMPIRDSCDEPFWHDGQRNWPGCKMREPRGAAEQAVLLLAETLFGDNPNVDRSKITGGKYWVQRRGPGNDVGFHYDKDEAHASIHQVMKFPIYSTVTYLSNWGAPTVIFNQTVMHNGNDEFPAEPDEAWLVHPRENRHMINRGDLHHGAVDVLTASPVPRGEDRLTFVVTWWEDKPLEPNCHDITDAEWPTELTRRTDAFLAQQGGAWGRLGPRRLVPPALPAMQGRPPSQLRRVHFPLGRRGKMMRLEVPRDLDGSVPYLLRWNASQASQAVRVFDEDDDRLLGEIFASRSPVAIVFGAESSLGGAHETGAAVGSGAGGVSASQRLVARVQLAARLWYRAHGVQYDPRSTPALDRHRLNVFTAGTEAVDTMSAFGIDADERGAGGAGGLPAAVVHLTQTDTKYVAGPSYHPLDAGSLQRFWGDVLGGRVEPLEEEGEEEDEEEGARGGGDDDAEL